MNDEYIVQSGDTLQSIAVRFYGDASMAQYIASINSLTAFDWNIAGDPMYKIYPQQVLKVGVATVKSTRLWPWAAGAGVIAAIVFRKRIAQLFKRK